MALLHVALLLLLFACILTGKGDFKHVKRIPGDVKGEDSVENMYIICHYLVARSVSFFAFLNFTRCMESICSVMTPIPVVYNHDVNTRRARGEGIPF